MDGKEIHGIISALIYSGLGMLVYVFFFILLLKISPFPIIKEIEEDQNISLSILIGSVMVGLSIIIASAIGS